MKNSIGPFLFGFILTILVMSGLVWYLTRGETPAAPKVQPVITSEDLEKAKNQSTDLKNYGDLPVTVNSSDVGRGNPFESY